MTHLVSKTLLAVLGAALALGACSKKEDKATDNAAAVDPKEAVATPPAADPKDVAVAAAPADHFAGVLMASYETCRALLAADTADGVAACAKGIAEASKSSQEGAPEAAQAHLATLGAAAEALGALPADDIEVLRLSFGEVSKNVVAMLGAAPEIAEGYHIFECPMAKGYQRWAQPNAELANPYMGSSMLTCGSEITE